MHPATRTLPCQARRRSESRWTAWLRRCWQQWLRSDDERFLDDACDLADLERRLRLLERGRPERFGSFPPGP
ncbi:hypothetical protein [Pelomonas cellulosilytica]|uniref:DUF3563 domain-containing protein n=1 Tax=Pelomonas cellulosilytica TaxID=2906762 RepID=A0ABS8XMQ8_9BURK|nr:hypothetical protein [Pelomonas sp. P8]MCE4554059.1 hypothetical protein [Pelomonas sp. P8]